MNIEVDFFRDNLIEAIGAGIYEISIEKNEKIQGSMPVAYKTTCSGCGKEVSTGDIIKSFQYEDDMYVVVSDDVLRK